METKKLPAVIIICMALIFLEGHYLRGQVYLNVVNIHPARLMFKFNNSNQSTAELLQKFSTLIKFVIILLN